MVIPWGLTQYGDKLGWMGERGTDMQLSKTDGSEGLAIGGLYGTPSRTGYEALWGRALSSSHRPRARARTSGLRRPNTSPGGPRAARRVLILRTRLTRRCDAAMAPRAKRLREMQDQAQAKTTAATRENGAVKDVGSTRPYAPPLPSMQLVDRSGLKSDLTKALGTISPGEFLEADGATTAADTESRLRDAF
jgi:hypothetical protein